MDPDTRRRCEADHVGEIWLADRSVAAGYWNDPEASAGVFQARLADDAVARPFLRTGDLGFLRDGELYVTGRLKDLVIVAGVNHYPHDIEWTVQSCAPELRRDHCAAFAISNDGVDDLIVIAEPDAAPEAWDAVLRRVRAAIAEAHDVDPLAIVIVRRGTIPKTSSGKLQRSACRQAYQNGELPAIAAWRRSARTAARASAVHVTDLQDWLRAELARVLELDAAEIALDAAIADLGVSSRVAVSLVARLEERLAGRSSARRCCGNSRPFGPFARISRATAHRLCRAPHLRRWPPAARSRSSGLPAGFLVRRAPPTTGRCCAPAAAVWAQASACPA